MTASQAEQTAEAAPHPRGLDPRTFRQFTSLIYKKAGIVLGPNKEALVSARVGKRMRAMGLTDFQEYYQRVEADASGDEMVELLNAISTNVTQFFREEQHFPVLAQCLARWAAEGQQRFRIWCAASSTGEEPYTIAMTVKETLHDVSDVMILATDLSTKVLNVARDGLYEKRHVEKVPPALLPRYFIRERNGKEDLYRAHPDLRKLLTFARLNLAEPPFIMKGPFDVIFCRNVMIYFDDGVRRRLVAEMCRLLKRGGYLMVGHAESLAGMLSTEIRSVGPSIYVKE
jgi:chemotaxis protein methyltransferase CheR